MSLTVVESASSPAIHLDSIVEFLRKRMDANARPKCKYIGLAHLTDDGASVIHTYVWQAAAKDADALDQEIHSAAHELYELACDSGSTHPRPQRYAVIAYGTGDSVISRKDFLVAPGVNSQLVGGETEPPNPTGVTSMLMRFCEAYSRNAILGQERVLQMIMGENARLSIECAELRKVVMERDRMIQEFTAQKLQHEMERAKERMETERSERLMGVFEKNILPQLLGAGDAPPVAAAFTKLGLRPDQMKTITESLDEQQITTLHSLLKPAAVQNGAP